MFAPRYFSKRYFAGRYFPPAGTVTPIIVGKIRMLFAGYAPYVGSRASFPYTHTIARTPCVIVNAQQPHTRFREGGYPIMRFNASRPAIRAYAVQPYIMATARAPQVRYRAAFPRGQAVAIQPSIRIQGFKPRIDPKG